MSVLGLTGVTTSCIAGLPSPLANGRKPEGLLDNRAAVGMTACLSDNILGDVPTSDGDINQYDLCGGEYRGFGSPELNAKSRR